MQCGSKLTPAPYEKAQTSEAAPTNDTRVFSIDDFNTILSDTNIKFISSIRWQRARHCTVRPCIKPDQPETTSSIQLSPSNTKNDFGTCERGSINVVGRKKVSIRCRSKVFFSCACGRCMWQFQRGFARTRYLCFCERGSAPPSLHTIRSPS